MKIYTLKTCDRCRLATKWLRENQCTFEEIPIREISPPLEAFRFAISNGLPLRSFLNPSGQEYRRLNLKDRLPEMSQEEVLSLLIGNGNLIKRPFLVTDDQVLVGFKAEEWALKLSSKA